MKSAGVIGIVLLLIAACAFPLALPNPAVTTVAVFTLLFAAAATSWNIFSGYTGYIALGHAVYFGLGSYAIALMCQDWKIPGGYLPFLLIPLAGVVAALFAVPFGWIALRTRRHAFIVITIATFFIMQLMAYNLRSITQGSAGISLPLPPPTWTGDAFNLPFYYGSLVILLLALATSWWVRNSKYGLGLLAIRDDEDRALGLGVSTGPFKLTAFVVSAFFVGMVGALHAYFIGSIFPPFAFDALFDVVVALMAFLGGIGTLAGPLVGAFILEPTQQYFTLEFSNNGYYLIIYGVLFLVIILLLPEGIVPTLQRYWMRLRSARTGPMMPADAAANSGSGRIPRGGRQNQERRREVMKLLEATNVSKSFGGIRALEACSIDVEQGSITGLIGPNGSGKTTLFNVVTCYEFLDSGEILFEGRSIIHATPDKVFRLGMARTFQLTRIFPRLTVLENMHVASQRQGFKALLSRWSSSQEQRRALELLDFVGISVLKDLPAGNLSYGQKKLLEFAYILIADPQVILLDEPAGGVNPVMINQLTDRIRTLNKAGVTFLIVEHNMEFVMGLCDRLMVMHRGSKIADGPPEQIRKNPAVLEAYLGG